LDAAGFYPDSLNRAGKVGIVRKGNDFGKPSRFKFQGNYIMMVFLLSLGMSKEG
jgi:hypothetical protein